jgi:hypothetical protein
MAGTPTQNGYNEAGGTDFSRKIDVIAGVRETSNGSRSLWPTPRTNNWTGPSFSHSGGASLQTEAFGTTPDGSSEPTAKPGGLNPAFVCWLMGYPPEWDACGATATPSSRRSRLAS